MKPLISPIRTGPWWAVVYAAAITPIDVDQIGLVNNSGPDFIKWVLRTPVWFLPLVFLVGRWGTLLEAIRRPPTSWLMAWAVLASVSVSWAFAPRQALLIGLATAGLVVLATWYVFTAGWHAFASAMCAGLTLSLLAGLLIDLVSGTLVADRAVGLTTGPTTFGRLAALNIVIAAGIIWSRQPKMIAWVGLVVGGAVLVFSETRTAIVAGLAGLLYGGLRRLSPLHRGVLVVGMVVALIGLIGLASTSGNLISFGERGDPASIAGRTGIWPLAWEFFLERPVLGYGWGASEPVFTEAARDGRISFLAFTSHSIVLAALLQGGVVGLTLLGSTLFSTWIHRRRVDAWVFAPIITILIGGLTEAIVHLPSVSVLLMAGVVAAVASTPRWPGHDTSSEFRAPKKVGTG